MMLNFFPRVLKNLLHVFSLTPDDVSLEYICQFSDFVVNVAARSMPPSDVLTSCKLRVWLTVSTRRGWDQRSSRFDRPSAAGEKSSAMSIQREWPPSRHESDFIHSPPEIWLAGHPLFVQRRQLPAICRASFRRAISSLHCNSRRVTDRPPVIMSLIYDHTVLGVKRPALHPDPLPLFHFLPLLTPRAPSSPFARSAVPLRAAPPDSDARGCRGGGRLGPATAGPRGHGSHGHGGLLRDQQPRETAILSRWGSARDSDWLDCRVEPIVTRRLGLTRHWCRADSDRLP
jgi:hypothetical protein